MNRDTAKDIVPINFYGYPITPDEINEEVDYVEAVVPGDKIVKLTGHVRMTIGAAGTCETVTTSQRWYWEDEKQGPEGFYDLLKSVPKLVHKIANERREAGKPFKRFVNNFERFGYQLAHDDEILEEVVEMGLAKWLLGELPYIYPGDKTKR